MSSAPTARSVNTAHQCCCNMRPAASRVAARIPPCKTPLKRFLGRLMRAKSTSPASATAHSDLASRKPCSRGSRDATRRTALRSRRVPAKSCSPPSVPPRPLRERLPPFNTQSEVLLPPGDNPKGGTHNQAHGESQRPHPARRMRLRAHTSWKPSRRPLTIRGRSGAKGRVHPDALGPRPPPRDRTPTCKLPAQTHTPTKASGASARAPRRGLEGELEATARNTNAHRHRRKCSIQFMSSNVSRLCRKRWNRTTKPRSMGM